MLNVCLQTDSLVYKIVTDDVYEDFYGDKNLFDFSDYPQDSKSFDHVNKKVIDKMKDGFKGKMYSLVAVDVREVKKEIGVNKNVLKIIRHKEFVDALFNTKIMRHNMKRIQSKLHKIGTFGVCKISFACFDDERYISGDGINSLAYFHKDTRSQ